MRAVLLLIFALGCREVRVVAHDARPGERVVLVAVDRSGRAVEAWTPVEGRPTLLPREHDVAQFILDPASFVGPDGRPLDAATLAAATLHLVDPASPSFDVARLGCGRCLAPSHRAPHVVYGGDLCPIPHFARADRDPELAAPIARQVRLLFPGDCACQRQAPVADNTVDLRPLVPAVDGWVNERIAVSPEGTIGMFSRNHATAVAPNGARVDRLAASGPMCGAPDRAWPFRGPVLDAFGLPGHRFLVVSFDPTDGEGLTRFDLFDSDLSSVEVVASPNELIPFSFHRLRPGAEFHLFARNKVNESSIQRCTLTERNLDCRPVTDSQFSFGAGRSGLTQLADGRVVVMGAPAGIALGRPDGERYHWDYSGLPNASGAGISGPPEWVHVVASVGQRVFACVQVGTTLAMLTGVVGSSTISWSYEVAFPTRCARLWFDGTQMLAVFANGTSQGFAPDTGRPLDRLLVSTAPRLGLEGAVMDVRSVEGVTLAVDAMARVHARRPGGGFSRVYGADTYDPTGTFTLLAESGGFAGFGDGGRRSVVRVDAGRPRHEVQPIPDLRARIVAAAPDRARGGYLLAGHDATTPELARLSADGAVERLEGVGAGVVAMAEAAPGIFVLALDDGRLLRLEGDAFTPIEIEWDDPETPLEDIQPTAEVLKKCFPSRPELRVPASGLPWAAASTTGGVVWVSGCGPTLLRVVPFGPAPYAQRVSFGRPDNDLYNPTASPPFPGAVHAFCPDHVLVGASGRGEVDSDRGRVWEVRPNMAGPSYIPGLSDVAVGKFAANDTSQQSLISLQSGSPVAFAGGPLRPSVLYAGGKEAPSTFQRYLAPERLRLTPISTSLAQSADDDVLLGSVHGRLFFGRNCAPAAR